jgi:hypothetical protein
MEPEPFGIMIFCTADPEVADAKIRSKCFEHCALPEKQSLPISA